ncbi:MAG: hypothetical protein Q8K26_03990 [Candidatus Gracilibacteria bacterium]|nr:hypothetical protein [Candidatus Gracilibacteria bacterium]
MKLLKNTNLYSRLALITSVTLVVGYFVVYAAYQTFMSSEYQSGAALSSTFLGKIVSNLDEINGRVTTLEGAIVGASVWSKVGSDINYTAGNVGIGTAAPTNKLSIKVAATGDDALNIYNSVGAEITELGLLGDDSGYLSMIDGNGGNSSIMLRADAGSSYINSGNVGIGTVSPSARLDVVGDTKSSRFYSIAVTTASTPSGVPVTIYDATGKNGLYLVSVDNYGDAVNYGAFAIVVVGSSSAKVLYNVGNVYMAGITTSGLMIQATQNSGATGPITATLTKLQ